MIYNYKKKDYKVIFLLCYCREIFSLFKVIVVVKQREISQVVRIGGMVFEDMSFCVREEFDFQKFSDVVFIGYINRVV